MTTTIRSQLLRSFRVVGGALWVAAVVLPLVVWMIGNLSYHVLVSRGVPGVPALPALAPPPHDAARLTAVVVSGSGGAEMTDFMVPFEVLGATGAFNVYVVAPERTVIPLANAAFRDGGLELVPHYAIDEFDRAIGRADVIVIPFLPTFADGQEARLVPWIRAQAERGALVVSICAGSEVLAATGLLDGGPATTHPNFFARLEARHPEVSWVRDVRYVERERTITSGAIASGMDASLAAVRRLLGREVAERVARDLGYPHFRFQDDPAHPARMDVWSSLEAAMTPLRSTHGVLLHDGVGELELGSVFDTYAQLLGERVVAVGARREPIVTRHGMRLLPRYALADAPALERLIVPGQVVPAAVAELAGRAAAAGDVEVVRVHEGRPGFPYDAVLLDLARRHGRVIAAGVATNLNYPIDHLALEGPPVRLVVIVMPLVVAAAGLLLLRGLRRRWRARRQRRVAHAGPADVAPAGA